MSTKCKFVATPPVPCKKWAFHAGFCKDHQTSVVVSTKVHAKENLFVNAPWRCFFCNGERNGVDYCPSCTQLYKSLGDNTHMIGRDLCSVVAPHLMWESTHVVLRGKRSRTLYEEAMAIWEPPEPAATATPADSKELKRTTPYLTAALEYIESGPGADKPLLFNAVNRQEVVRHYIGKVMYTFMIPDLIHIISTYASAMDIIKVNEWVDVGIDETLLWPLDLSTLDNQGKPLAAAATVDRATMAHRAATVAAMTGGRPMTITAASAAAMAAGVPSDVATIMATGIPPAPGPGGMFRQPPYIKSAVVDGDGETKRRSSLDDAADAAAAALMASAAIGGGGVATDIPAAPAFMPPPVEEEIGAPPPDAPPLDVAIFAASPAVPPAAQPQARAAGMRGPRSNNPADFAISGHALGSIPVGMPAPKRGLPGAATAAGGMRGIAGDATAGGGRAGLMASLRREVKKYDGAERTSISVFPLLDEQGALKISASSSSSSSASVAAATTASLVAATAAAAANPLSCRWRPGRVIKIDGLRVLVGVKMDRWWRQCRPNMSHPYTSVWVHLLDTARIRSVAPAQLARRRPWNFIPYFDIGGAYYTGRRPLINGDETYDMPDADFELLPYDPARKRAGQLGLYYGGIEHESRSNDY